MEGDAEADFDAEEAVGGGHEENFERVTEVERFVDGARRVDLDAVEGEGAFGGREEAGCRGGTGQVPVGKEGEEDGGGAFDEEEVSPGVEGPGVDLKDPEGEEAGECAGDVGRGVEDGEAAGQFAAAVEGRLVVDYEWEEGGFRHSEEPSQYHHAGEVLRGNPEDGEDPKATHHDWQDPAWTELLSKHPNRWSEYDIGYVKH